MMLRLGIVTLLTSLGLSAQTGRLDFRVIAVGDAPVAGASITVEGPASRTYSGTTGRDGHFRLADLAPGVYRFTEFNAPGYVRNPRNFLTEVSIHDGHTREFQFELQPAPKINGVLFNEDGKPVQGARLIAHSPRTSTLNGEATTDSNGHYSMTLNASPESFLSTVALPTLVVPATVQRSPNEVPVTRQSGQATTTVEFELPLLPLSQAETTNLYLRPIQASIR